MSNLSGAELAAAPGSKSAMTMQRQGSTFPVPEGGSQGNIVINEGQYYQ